MLNWRQLLAKAPPRRGVVSPVFRRVRGPRRYESLAGRLSWETVVFQGLTNSTSRTMVNRIMKSATPTTLGYALLGLLHQEPRSGYDLRKIFETTPMGHCSGSPGAIYPALRRLEQQGLIEGQVDHTTSLRPRQVFRPTETGTEMFQKWLARDVQRDDVIWRLDELMLRFAFHSFLESNTASRKFLTGFVAEVNGYIKELRQQLKMVPTETPIHGKLALESGVELYQAHRRWARKALEHFDENES
jgi:DNA-binding PadR family transcriptional regulator